MKKATATKSPAATTADHQQVDDSQWVEEWVPLEKVIRHKPFQVRNKLDLGKVKEYADRTRAGSEPPPIKVGRVNGALYLIDGHHRMGGGALVTMSDPFTGAMEVRVMVRDLSLQQARWEAAKVNMGHGVPLKLAEYRNVFKAYIKSKQHLNADGSLKTFREIGAEIGKGHTTIYGWMGKYFPALLAKMGGNEHGNPKGSPTPAETPTLEDEHVSEASKALHALVQHATALKSPVSRWHLARGLENALAKLRSAGVEEPEPEQF